MQDFEIIEYLDSTETTDEQFAQIRRAADDIEQQYPVPADGTVEDVADERREALAEAVQSILGDE